MISSLPQDVLDKLNVLGLEKLKDFHFAVQIDSVPAIGLGSSDVSGYLGATLAGFNHVEGLSGSVEVREVQEGGYRGRHYFPRKVTSSTVKLTRGMTFSRALYNWYQEVVNWDRGQPDYRRQVSIFMLDRISTAAGPIDYEVWEFVLSGAWPAEWTGPRLNSMGDSIAFESITIRHSGISEARGLFSGKAGEILSLFN